MIITERNNNNENQTIKLKRSPTIYDLSSQMDSLKKLRQVCIISYRVNQEQYQIKVSHHLQSWQIPYRYYNMNMDPVNAFLRNNTIKNYINRVYWMNKKTVY